MNTRPGYSPPIVDTPHTPVSGLPAKDLAPFPCSACGTVSIAWHDSAWTSDCQYDGACWSCFSEDQHDSAGIFGNRLELNPDGSIAVYGDFNLFHSIIDNHKVIFCS